MTTKQLQKIQKQFTILFEDLIKIGRAICNSNIEKSKIENKRIDKELHKCESCGRIFNAHKLACLFIHNNIKENEIILGKKIFKIGCPHCDFIYDLEVGNYEQINN